MVQLALRLFSDCAKHGDRACHGAGIPAEPVTTYSDSAIRRYGFHLNVYRALYPPECAEQRDPRWLAFRQGDHTLHLRHHGSTCFYRLGIPYPRSLAECATVSKSAFYFCLNHFFFRGWCISNFDVPHSGLRSAGSGLYSAARGFAVDARRPLVTNSFPYRRTRIRHDLGSNPFVSRAWRLRGWIFSFGRHGRQHAILDICRLYLVYSFWHCFHFTCGEQCGSQITADRASKSGVWCRQFRPHARRSLLT